VVPYLVNIFFSDNSYSIQSEIEADISAIISYDWIYLKLPYWQAVTSVQESNTFIFYSTISKINPYK
jgi:hypothetical protein